MDPRNLYLVFKTLETHNSLTISTSPYICSSPIAINGVAAHLVTCMMLIPKRHTIYPTSHPPSWLEPPIPRLRAGLMNKSVDNITSPMVTSCRASIFTRCTISLY